MKIPNLVSEDNVEDILELSKSIALREMVDPVRNALQLFERNISRLIFLNPEIPHIEFRHESMKILFESMSNEMKPAVYRDFMREVGKRIGKSLGHDMLGFLIKNNKLPKSDAVMTRIWNEWDMVAGWGKIKSKHDDRSIIIDIEDSWITRSLDGDVHRHCPLIEGYIFGFLWVVMKERYRWFKRSIAQSLSPPIEPVSVSETAQGDKCRFVVTLGEESLQEAFDALSDAREDLRTGNLGQVANNIRISLELALKEKLGIDKNERTSLIKITKALKRNNVEMKYKAIDEIYNLTSRIMHGAKKSDTKVCSDIVARWDEIIEDIELMEIPKKDDIRKEILSM